MDGGQYSNANWKIRLEGLMMGLENRLDWTIQGLDRQSVPKFYLHYYLSPYLPILFALYTYLSQLLISHYFNHHASLNQTL